MALSTVPARRRYLTRVIQIQIMLEATWGHVRAETAYTPSSIAPITCSVGLLLQYPAVTDSIPVQPRTVNRIQTFNGNVYTGAINAWRIQVMSKTRIAVFLIYLAYLVVIVIALASDLLPLAETVLVCLSVHFVGLLGGFAIGYDTYPKVLGKARRPIIYWDWVQAGVLIALAIIGSGFAVVAAVVAIIGILGCFYKVYAVSKLMKCSSAKKGRADNNCTHQGCDPGCCGCDGGSHPGAVIFYLFFAFFGGSKISSPLSLPVVPKPRPRLSAAPSARTRRKPL